MNLTEKHRPRTFDEVVGHESVIASLRRVLDKKSHSSFLFDGPSGVGKTTLARICATELGCSDLREMDAASNSGVDDMRTLARAQEYFTAEGGARVFIIDECQRLSKNGWDALLKATEEPPEGNYWFFCTTEFSKVPKTIQTRCARFSLKPLGSAQIVPLLREICDEECIGLEDETLEWIAGSVGGSPREALVRLQQAEGMSPEEASALFTGEAYLPIAYDLAKMISRSSFDAKEVMDLLVQMKDESPESIRQVVRAYFTTFVMRAPTNRYALGVLAEFEKPAVEQNRITDIVMRIARINKWKNQ